MAELSDEYNSQDTVKSIKKVCYAFLHVELVPNDLQQELLANRVYIEDLAKMT